MSNSLSLGRRRIAYSLGGQTSLESCFYQLLLITCVTLNTLVHVSLSFSICIRYGNVDMNIGIDTDILEKEREILRNWLTPLWELASLKSVGQAGRQDSDESMLQS